MKNIVASWKTTLLGLLIIGAGIAYIFVVQDSKVFQFAILLIIGIGFLFAPDTIIDGLRSIIKNNKEKNFNMEAVLTRELEQDKQTLGSLVIKDDEGKKLFSCKTLELPWNANKKNESCIPLGNYKVSLRQSAKYNKHYHIQDVPGRSFVLIHIGNFNTQTKGCILVGEKLADLNADGYKDVNNSKATLQKLLKIAPEGFDLEIKRKPKKDAEI